MADDASIYVFHADTEGLNFRRAFADAGFYLSGTCIWKKQSLVLDPFGGSGSTLIACEQTDRSCCTIELDEKFCDVIVKRYIEQVGTDADVSVQRDGLPYRYHALVVTEG